MAVVAIGDFADPQAVVNMIQKHMGKCQAANEQGEQIPRLVIFYLMLCYDSQKAYNASCSSNLNTA